MLTERATHSQWRSVLIDLVKSSSHPRGAGSSKNSSWSARTEEMSGGQHRNDEVNGPSRSGERETEGSRKAREQSTKPQLRRYTGVLRKTKKLRRNILDGADFVRDVIDSYQRSW